MRDVSIIGIGQTKVGEHWETGLRALGAEAVQAALDDAGVQTVDALYVGSAYAASISNQSQLGALIADYAGMGNLEAFTVEAAEASGAAALRTGYLAVASGAVDVAMVLGVEKSTDMVAEPRTLARSISLDADYEAIQGATATAQAALLMRRYMHDYGLDVSAFEGFSLNAHANGAKNPNAMYRNLLKPGAFGKAPLVADPVNLFDSAPDGDGAAAVILVSGERAPDMAPLPVRIAGSAVATDALALHDRDDLLYLKAVALSAQKACQQAGISAQAANVYELHDAFTVLTALALEAMGFAERGQGWKLATDAQIGLAGATPISTFGGLKARGNPVGATGVYQAVEATLQLRGQAANNQVAGARTALIQNLGGMASTAITHVLRV
ncbi:MAG: thiolase domain-containing protein [Anaerolineae bacterium]|nr:thiolase domain-containing protein [Anaerolineae bacterium]